jgi:hypothetical protein
VTTTAVSNAAEAALRSLLKYPTAENRIVQLNAISLCTQMEAKKGASWNCVNVFEELQWAEQRTAHAAALELALCVLHLAGEPAEQRFCSAELFHSCILQ